MMYSDFTGYFGFDKLKGLIGSTITRFSLNMIGLIFLSSGDSFLLKTRESDFSARLPTDVLKDFCARAEKEKRSRQK